MTHAQAHWRPSGPVAGLLYVAAIVVLVDQAAILAASVFPPNLGAVQWRFGAVGLAAGRATPFVLGDLLLISAAFLAGHRLLLRVVATIHLLAAILLLGALGLFVLDALEIRQLLPLDARRQTLVGAGRAAVALLALSAYCMWSGVMVFRRTPRPPRQRSADRRIVVETHGGGA